MIAGFFVVMVMMVWMGNEMSASMVYRCMCSSIARGVLCTKYG
jgi:hypothetical protein